jgi:hypothetical protein
MQPLRLRGAGHNYSPHNNLLYQAAPTSGSGKRNKNQYFFFSVTLLFISDWLAFAITTFVPKQLFPTEPRLRRRFLRDGRTAVYRSAQTRRLYASAAKTYDRARKEHAICLRQIVGSASGSPPGKKAIEPFKTIRTTPIATSKKLFLFFPFSTEFYD